MPRYRSPRKRTDEEQMKLKVDLRLVPEWEAELKSMTESFHNRLQISLSKISSAANLIHEMLRKTDTDLSRTVDWECEQQKLEQWKDSLTADNLLFFDTLNYEQRGRSMVGKIRASLKEAEDTLVRIKASGVTDSRWVSFFTGKWDVETVQSWETARAKYLALSREIPRIENAIRILEEAVSLSRDYATRTSPLRDQLSLAEEKRAAIERFEAKHGKALAKAATADKKTRKRVTSLKSLVKKTNDCPYCGGDLGVDPHLDHIYPVAKGGLSIVENLVWCCSTCNILKSDKGLMQFLKDQCFPIEQTLARLHSLNKHV